MVSTIIVILLAAAAIFWKPPFSIAPLYHFALRRGRRIVFGMLLLPFIATETHTPLPVAALNDKPASNKCAKELKASLKDGGVVMTSKPPAPVSPPTKPCLL
jgi:hypothetical protein